jgi:glycosyltransferase involved in cell wall biosynthesis
MTLERLPWITASISHFGCRPYISAAVESLLSQTYPCIRVIVINDGDSRPPWGELDHIRDPRLVRFELGENRGPYFCHAVALEATPDPLFLIQDADDWSAPRRVECLLACVQRRRAIYAFSAQARFYTSPSGGVVEADKLFVTPPETRPDHNFKYRIPHHGLFLSGALRALGGYYGGFPFNYDKLLMNFVLLSCRIGWSPEVLYWYRVRGDSLTANTDTGIGSAQRRRLNGEMAAMYRAAYGSYCRYRENRWTHRQLLQSIRRTVEMRQTSDVRHRLTMHAERLRAALRGRTADANAAERRVG